MKLNKDSGKIVIDKILKYVNLITTKTMKIVVIKGGEGMFNIYLNGKKRDIDEGRSISDLLEVNEIKPEIVVVEINDKIIERGKYKDTILIVKDRVEFVYYMGGG